MSEDAFSNFLQIPLYRITMPFYSKLKQAAFGSFWYFFVTIMYKLCTEFTHLCPTVCIFLRVLQVTVDSEQCTLSYVQAPQIIRSSQELPDDQLKLKRVSDLMTAYENIVDGNYIDNLIRGQKDREQSKMLDKRS